MATDEPPIDATASSPAGPPSPIEATPPIEAAAPPAPIEAAAAHAPIEPELPTFRPRPVRGALAAAFWAGLVGGGAGLWATGVYGALLQNDVIEGPRPETFFPLCYLGALCFALWRGYRDPIRSYVGLFGRVLGASLFGVLACALVTVVVAVVLEGNHVDKGTIFFVLSLFGIAMAGLALRHHYGIGSAERRRMAIAGGLAAVLLVSLWPVSPGLRCRLGSGEACLVAARSADTVREAIASGERGCARDDAPSCQIAAQAYLDGEGVFRDTGKALHLFRTACALGDDRGCERAHGASLIQRCDRSSAVACRDLGAALRKGVEVDRNAAGATLAYRKACLLGASDACAEAGNR